MVLALEGIWRAVDGSRFAQGILFQRHVDTEAAKTFLKRLLADDDVPEVIHTDQLCNSGAAIRETPNLTDTDSQQVISTAGCNNITRQSHRLTRRQERSGQA
jgi:putative transposase